METITRPGVAAPAGTGVRHADHAHQAYQLLHFGFVVAPLIAGLDKFFHLLANWDNYLSPVVVGLANRISLTGHNLMLIVGGIEVIAALIVAFAPRIGAWIVALWLAAIIANLLLIPGYYDIALRDFGLLLGAIALARLSMVYSAH